MLIPTNNGIFAPNDIEGPIGCDLLRNDELCTSIPGPVCGGEGGSPFAEGEGFVHVHTGIHGIGSLPAADFNWCNPEAEISIRRVTR